MLVFKQLFTFLRSAVPLGSFVGIYRMPEIKNQRFRANIVVN
jgi:hypothetical protein